MALNVRANSVEMAEFRQAARQHVGRCLRHQAAGRLMPWLPSFDVSRDDIMNIVLTRSLSGLISMRVTDRDGILDRVTAQLHVSGDVSYHAP
jgi:hypothetical protein